MESNKRKHIDINLEKKKLRKRKMLSTGLLIFITIIYCVFKKLKLDESGNLFYSSLVAFTEASMIGALADWFAVVALFRHPLGMKWIPHTAIIKNSKENVSATLSTFVVDNFFTHEKIMDILKDIKLSKKLNLYLTDNKGSITNFIVQRIPKIVTELSKNNYLRDLIVNMLNDHLDKIQLSQLAGKALKIILTSNDSNIKLVKYALILFRNEIGNNEEAIIDYIKQQKFFGIIGVPTMVAETIYTNIDNFIDGEIRKIDNNVISGISQILLNKLDQIPVSLETSDEVIEKVSHLKEEFMKSEDYINFTSKTLWDLIENDVVNPIIINCENCPEKFSEATNKFIENIISDIFSSEETCKEIDNWAIRNVDSVVSTNRMKIGELISNSVNEWNEDEMVEKIELMIGSDLQYIRINGTVVGGLVGVLIHLISHIFI